MHSEVGSSSVCMEVDGQLGWRTPWQPGSLRTRVHLLCSDFSMVKALNYFIILSIFMWIVFSVLAIGISSLASSGAAITSLEIAGRLTITGICGSRTSAGIEL